MEGKWAVENIYMVKSSSTILKFSNFFVCFIFHFTLFKKLPVIIPVCELQQNIAMSNGQIKVINISPLLTFLYDWSHVAPSIYSQNTTGYCEIFSPHSSMWQLLPLIWLWFGRKLNCSNKHWEANARFWKSQNQVFFCPSCKI